MSLSSGKRVREHLPGSAQ